MVVTFNPRTQRKQQHEFERNLDAFRKDLLVMQAKVRENAPQWKDAEAIRDRYVARCEGLHLPPDLYELKFSTEDGQVAMTFAKSAYRTQQRERMFGKNLIVTDNHDWTTTEIVHREGMDDQQRLAYLQAHSRKPKPCMHTRECGLVLFRGESGMIPEDSQRRRAS